MSLTPEDLRQIGELLDEKLAPIHERLDKMAEALICPDDPEA